MNGYDPEIFEMHDKAGGLCTAWKRKQYTIDGCIHWLTGSREGSSFYKLWQELGAIQGRRIIDHDVFYRFKGLNGRSLIIYCDADKLERHLKELSPQDSDTIELLCRLIRKFTKFQMPIDKAYELYNVWDIAKLIVKMLPFSRDVNFCSGVTIGEFSNRFKDPMLRELFPKILWEKDLSLLSLVVTLAGLHAKESGSPKGGRWNSPVPLKKDTWISEARYTLNQK